MRVVDLEANPLKEFTDLGSHKALWALVTTTNGISPIGCTRDVRAGRSQHAK